VLGVLGCMAERLRKDLIEEKKVVDLVVGPDEYRRLPEFIDTAFGGEKGIGVKPVTLSSITIKVVFNSIIKPL